MQQKIAGPYAIWSWVVGTIIIMLIALCFAELGALFPRSGALIVASTHWGVMQADPNSYRFTGIFTALPAAGIVFSYLGFRTAIDLGGESLDRLQDQHLPVRPDRPGPTQRAVATANRRPDDQHGRSGCRGSHARVMRIPSRAHIRRLR